jgi:hypothetical protein
MKRNVSDGEPEKLAKQLASLGGLAGKRLKERWRSLYGAELPARLSRSLLVQAIAYRLQDKAFGGLKPATRGSCSGSPRKAPRVEPRARRPRAESGRAPCCCASGTAPPIR